MPPSPGSSSAEAYAVAWRLHQITEEARQSFEATASKLGLSAPQARLVLRLFEPTPMRDIADHLGCDASNVTGIVARLVARGLVSAAPGSDRRVKLLELTPRGRRVRKGLEQSIARTAPAMTRLDQIERKALLQLLDKLLPIPREGRSLQSTSTTTPATVSTATTQGH